MNAEVMTVMPAERAEINAVADEMAKAYRNMVKHYVREVKMSAPDAARHVTEQAHSEQWIEQIMETPVRQLSWQQLSDLEEYEPGLSIRKWEEVKAEMQAYVDSGRLAADVLSGKSPLDRAKYFALRESLARDWQPRNGMEDALLEQMAMALMRTLEWQYILSNWMGWLDYDGKDDKMPRVSTDRAIERATEMIDRFNRMFLRTLRSLRDLRRYNNPVIVQNAGQVNVGAQQINVAPTAE
jgi:hypothetical protein